MSPAGPGPTTTPGPRRQPHVELRLGDLDRLSVSVAIAPYVSVLSLLTDTFRRRRVGPCRPLEKVADTVLRTVDETPVRPMIEPGYSVAPDVVVPIPPHADVPAPEHLDYLRSAPGEAVTDDLVGTFGSELPAHWNAVAEHPTRWLREYADTASSAWKELEPLWKKADMLLEREIDRVAIASTRRQHGALLDNLAAKVRFVDGSLVLPDAEPAVCQLGDRPLVLVPMLSDSRSVIANFDRPEAVWIAYPLPGQGLLEQADHPPMATSTPVETVLGPHRAAILRALDLPMHMSALASQLHYTPSTLTHHCDRLADAGLISRQRRGRQMRVSRTERGVALLDLLGGS